MCDGALCVVDTNYNVHPNNIWSGYLSDLAAENDNMWAQRQERTFEISGQKWR